MKHPLSPVEKVPSLDELRRDTHSRRAFLARMGAAGLGFAAISLLQGCDGDSGPDNGGGGGGNFPLSRSVAPGRNNNERVLNYALQLETLEADLYRQALNIASGRDRSAPLGSSPNEYQLAVPGGDIDGFETQAGFAYLAEFAFVEAAHRDFLRTFLQSLGAPVIQPQSAYNFGPLAPASPTLNALLTAILPLEETGVRAYLGAAPFITKLDIVQVATAIYSTEAKHSAAVRLILDVQAGDTAGPSPSADVPGYPPSEVVPSIVAVSSGNNGTSNGYPEENTFEYKLDPPRVLGIITQFFGPGDSSSTSAR